MSNTRSAVIAKAEAYVVAIHHLRPAERARILDESLVADFNALRSAALSVQPNLDKLLPPELDSVLSPQFATLLIYAEQIVRLLNDQ
jgi:hypothetical protein